MKNKEKWKPSKYVYKNGKLKASRDQREVGVGSTLITDIIAGVYDKNFKQYASGKLLDLGCGKVPFYESYRQFITDNICVDWVNTLHTNKYIDYELDLTKRLPFQDSEFDTIVVSDVLEHIPCPEQLWKEMARILSNNGKILMNVPFYYWIHEQPHDYYRSTEFALQRFVEMAGLNLIKIETIGGVPEIIADIVAKNILRLPKLGRSISIFVQCFALYSKRIKFVKRMSKQTSAKFPLGYFLVAVKSC